tara:strand:+ start:935 stop:1132 length:198 start_codon:yes stop_codon:yes gene_type:complete
VNKYIDNEIFNELDTGCIIKTRFMGYAITQDCVNNNKEIRVKFTTGPWKDKELYLIREQIKKICG